MENTEKVKDYIRSANLCTFCVGAQTFSIRKDWNVLKITPIVPFSFLFFFFLNSHKKKDALINSCTSVLNSSILPDAHWKPRLLHTISH